MVTDQLPQGEAKVAAVRGMFDTIAPRYDLVNRLMTFGLDRGWRRRTVAELGGLGSGEATEGQGPAGRVLGGRVLDVACGTGDLCRELSAAGHKPVGIDLSVGMLANARAAGTPLLQGDALTMPFPDGSFDGAVSGFALRNVVDLPQLFAELSRVVRPGGRIALLDVAAPTNPVLRLGHKVWFERAVPLIGGALSDPSAYRYLPKSVAYLPPAPQVVEQLKAAGFSDAAQTYLTLGITQLYTATRDRG